MSIFTPKISDDLFFSHRPGFSDFACVIYCDKMSYTTISEKNSLIRPFFCSVHPFALIRQHYFSKYWGTNAWAVPPPQILEGPSPQSPRSPPLPYSLTV